MMKSSNFLFGVGSAAQAIAVARIPASVSSKQQLFAALQVGLALPDYFGANWDALDECIQTLDWLAPGCVRILHEDVPSLDEKALRIYLGILQRGASKWSSAPNRKLEVIFPREAEHRVLNTLHAAQEER